jgi:hypothetical protein
MTATQFNQMHGDLAANFGLYLVSQSTSPLGAPLTYGDEPRLVFQTADPEFNAWALQFALRCRERDDVQDRPIALYYVPVPNPPSVAEVDWSQARFLARLVMMPDVHEHYKKAS